MERFYIRLSVIQLKIKIRKFFKNIIRQIPPLFAYFGSMVSIYSLKFVSEGKFAFDVNNIFDWFSAAVILVALVVGTLTIWDSITKEKEIIVSREELSYLLNAARGKASSSIISVCGDLSWLNDDAASLTELRKKNKCVIKIIYDKSKVSTQTTEIIRDLAKKGIIFIPYEKFEGRPKRNYLIVDSNTDEIRPIIMYEKIKDSEKGKEDDKFSWKESTLSTDKSLAFVMKFIEHCEEVKNPIKIGISGVNNVGKTTLMKYCESQLKELYYIKSFEDEFDKFKCIDSFSNVTMLHNQILNQKVCGNFVVLFDRTSIDNYLYFKCRTLTEESLGSLFSNPNSSTIMQNFLEEVNSSMDELDLLVMVENSSNNKIDSTYVKNDLRKKVKKELVNFVKEYRRKNKKVINIELKNDDSDAYLQKAYKKISDELENIIIEKNAFSVRVEKQFSSVIDRLKIVTSDNKRRNKSFSK